MPISTKLKDYLEREDVLYDHHVHPEAYTAQETAAAAHIPGREMVKSIILNADGALVMAVLSANHTANLDVLRNAIGCSTLRLATEAEFRNAFPTCQVGAMPPFGNIFNIATYCEATLDRNREIEFNAGTHYDTIRMTFADFKRLVDPKVIRFAETFREHPQRLAS
ncbi:MAG: YbaK/EbsC family protein [Acidobacteria bacterium]|nr:YbaK/EbsC family protein [Acidobacteriota bacterium]